MSSSAGTIPRSKIFVTPSTTHTTTPTSSSTSSTTCSKDGLGRFHRFEIMMCEKDTGIKQLVEDCQGTLECHNCGVRIPKRVYLYAERKDKDGTFICHPTPHCRPECVYRTIQDFHNRDDVLQLFFIMYGTDIICAPPRFMLHALGPSKLTQAQYHELIDSKRIVVEDPPWMRSVVGPVYLSTTRLKDHQLLPEAVAFADAAHEEKHTALGPEKVREPDTNVVVAELPPKSLTRTKLTAIFTPDPSSYVAPSLQHAIEGDCGMDVDPYPS